MSTESERPSYYAVIPAEVRYDKNLKDKSKLLYGEISALCSKNGKCWATNDYFASLYETSVRTITRLLTELCNCGYITVDFDGKNNRQICLQGRQNCPTTLDKIVQNTLDKIVYQNNTSNTNNTSNNNTPYNPSKGDDEVIKKKFNMFWKVYPKKKDKSKTEKWFLKNNPDEELMKIILTKLELFKKTEEWQKCSGKYVPYPTTWLNGKRWEDEIDINTVVETEEEELARIQAEIDRRKANGEY